MYLKKRLQDMTIQDAFLFAAVMADSKKCRKLLEIILDVPILEVTIITEKTMAYHPEFHGIRLDVLAEEKGTKRKFNVEMQVKKKDNLPKRSRYYHSQMDMDMLTTGVDYEKLPECYVIFICDFDPFGDERFVYSIRNVCKENGGEVEDGAQTIWLSTKGKNEEDIPEELVNFLRYVGNATKKKKEDTYQGFVKELEDSICEIKRSREWEAKFMLLQEMIKDVFAEGRSQGIEEGRNQGITEGRNQGVAESIIELLMSFEKDIPEDVLERIRQEENESEQKRWLMNAARVESLAEFIQKM